MLFGEWGARNIFSLGPVDFFFLEGSGQIPYLSLTYLLQASVSQVSIVDSWVDNGKFTVPHWYWTETSTNHSAIHIPILSRVCLIRILKDKKILMFKFNLLKLFFDIDCHHLDGRFPVMEPLLQRKWKPSGRSMAPCWKNWVLLTKQLCLSAQQPKILMICSSLPDFFLTSMANIIWKR